MEKWENVPAAVTDGYNLPVNLAFPRLRVGRLPHGYLKFPHISGSWKLVVRILHPKIAYFSEQTQGLTHYNLFLLLLTPWRSIMTGSLYHMYVEKVK
jgi:hypothetical protein